VKLQILLAEDSEFYAVLLREALHLSRLDDDLHTVANGEEAISYLEGKGAYADTQKYPVPHYVLLDLNLPAIHGYEVIKTIRAKARFKSLPIHVLNGAAREPDIDRVGELGATSYIVKPENLFAMTGMLHRLHRMHETTSQPNV
jgi:CheY-like chemotaxis protein